MSGHGGVTADQLRAFVERIENVEEEIKALNEAKKEIFAEAKGEGYDVKIIKEVIRIRKQDADERDERETLVDLYLRAVQGASTPEAKAA
ncbi:MAG: hypothetical protein JWN07_2404 [Hyphomicrobiales bacterium]|nr:hypothetical protein [Hyphomicrobiales bacterium]